MIYGYTCPSCSKTFDVIKRVSEYDKEEKCVCGSIAKRSFAPQRIHLYGTAVVEQEYNPGLGCIVKNKAHKKEILKAKGLEEIGNEKPETIHKHYEKVREEKREKAWQEADRGWVGEG